MVKKNPGANINKRGQTFSLYDYYLNPEKYADQVDSQTNTDNVFNQGNDNVQTYAEFPTTGSNDGLTYQGTPGGNTGSGLFDLIDNSGKDFGPYTKTSMAPQTSTVPYDQQDDIRQNFGRGLTDDDETFDPTKFGNNSGKTFGPYTPYKEPSVSLFDRLLNLGPGKNATDGTLAGNYEGVQPYISVTDDQDELENMMLPMKKPDVGPQTTYYPGQQPFVGRDPLGIYDQVMPPPKKEASGLAGLIENSPLLTALGDLLPKDTAEQSFLRNAMPTNEDGRIAYSPVDSVFGGMNAVSAFGDISTGGQKRIDNLDKTISKMTAEQKAKSSLPERKAKFEKELAEFNQTRKEDLRNTLATEERTNKSMNQNVDALAREYDRENKGRDPDPQTTSTVNKAKAQVNMPSNLSFNTGGDSGGGDSCFLPDTLVTMANGSVKKIIDVDIGDEVAVGGKVFATGKFLNDELYDYKGVKVSGSHMVNEDGVWMRIRDTKHGISLGDDENIVYVFGSENRRILINNILFTDYFETKEQDKLLDNEEDFFKNWKSHGKTVSDENVDALNAV
tara:strand:- start:483 stop:2162 length:1680 start_codon:yes stop_codon:yes gene_type:complete